MGEHTSARENHLLRARDLAHSTNLKTEMRKFQ